MRHVLVLALAVLWGCGMSPVENPGEVDRYIGQGRFANACFAFQNKENDEVRRYAAEKLAARKDDAETGPCICEALYVPGSGTWDKAIGQGLSVAERDDLATCFSAALKDDKIPVEDLPELVTQVGKLNSPVGWSALVQLSTSSAPPIARGAAVKWIDANNAEERGIAVKLLADPAPEVRAGAALALGKRTEPEVIAALIERAGTDEDETVRDAALETLGKVQLPESEAVFCDRMLNDTSEKVRDQAVRSFHGAKRKERVACLRKKLLTREDSPMVRTSTMNALEASKLEEAALALCDGIPFFMRTYATEEAGIVEDQKGMNIIEIQNQADPNRSYECVEKALRQGDYSCYARNHLGHWMNTYGGKASTPWCPGMVKLGEAGGEVSFE